MVDHSSHPEAPPARGAPHPRTVSPTFERTNARAGIGWILTLLAVFAVWGVIWLIRYTSPPITRGTTLLWTVLFLGGGALLAWALSRNLSKGMVPTSRGDPGR